MNCADDPFRSVLPDLTSVHSLRGDLGFGLSTSDQVKIKGDQVLKGGKKEGCCLKLTLGGVNVRPNAIRIYCGCTSCQQTWGKILHVLCYCSWEIFHVLKLYK